MGVTDALWMAAIVGGAVYLFYRSFWKKRGCCQGCSNAGCSRRTLAVTGSLLGCMLMSTVPAAATEPGGPSDAASPLTAVQAELYHTPAERLAAGLESSITKHVTISGLLEVEASFADSGSSLTLATAQLGLGVRTEGNFGGTLVLLAENGGDPAVDEATIDFATGRWSARAGRQLLPFGRFNSHFVTDPLTRDLGETKEMAILGGITSDWLALSAFAFDGDAKEAGDEERIQDWGVAITITPAEGVKIGVSYLTDLADSSAGLFVDTGNLYHQRVAGWSACAVTTVGPVELSAEALGAVESFTAADGGGRPAAWNVEVAHDPTPSVEFALRYEGGHDLPKSVERRYGAVASWSPQEHVSITAEFLRAESGEGTGEENVVTARLALEF